MGGVAAAMAGPYANRMQIPTASCSCQGGVFWRPLPTVVQNVSTTFANCVCTEVAALVIRTFPDGPVPSERGIGQFRRQIHLLERSLRRKDKSTLLPWSEERFLASMDSTRRQRYADAFASLAIRPVERRDARVSMFVKGEKGEYAQKANAPLKPRAIQGRQPRYNAAFGLYTKPIEEVLYRWKGPKRGVPTTRVIAKGLCQSRRADLFWQKISAFDRPTVLTTDIKSFDGSVRVEHLQAVHGLYMSLLPDPSLQRLLSWQLHNVCTTANGVRYRVKGKRMSGDMDTALGNCLITVNAVAAALRLLGVRKYDLMDDGDDCLVILEQSESRGLRDRFIAAMSEVGFNSESSWCGSEDGWEPEDVSFCRSKLLFAGGKWRFVRNYERMMCGFLCTHKHYSESAGAKRIMKAMAQCEAYCCRGIPVMQPMATRILHLLGGVKYPKQFETMGFARKAVMEAENLRATFVPEPITVEARVSFAKAFGIPIEEQLELEDWSSTIMLDNIDPALAVDVPMDGTPARKVGEVIWHYPHELECRHCYQFGAHLRWWNKLFAWH